MVASAALTGPPPAPSCRGPTCSGRRRCRRGRSRARPPRRSTCVAPPLAPELPQALDERGEPGRVEPGELPPPVLVGITPSSRVLPDATNGPPSPGPAEPVRLELHDRRDRERVVQRGDVDVVHRDPRLTERGRLAGAMSSWRSNTSPVHQFRMLWPVPMPSTRTGVLRQVTRRSVVVTITTTAPSVSRQQSSNRNGSTTIRELWWSSIVIGGARTRSCRGAPTRTRAAAPPPRPDARRRAVALHVPGACSRAPPTPTMPYMFG